MASRDHPGFAGPLRLLRGIGNPAKATAEKGEAYVSAAVERIASFLVELAALQLDDLYQ